MDPFWLTFRDASLESQFETFAVEGSLLLQDRVFLYSSLITTMWAMVELEPRGGTFAVLAPLVLYALWLLLDLTLRNALGHRNMLAYRTPLVVITRSVLCVTHALRAPHWLPGAVVDTEPANVIAVSLSAIGVWSEFAMAIGLPLKFKAHLLVQLPMVLVFLCLTSSSCCQYLMESPAKSTLAQTAVQFGNPLNNVFTGDFISPLPDSFNWEAQESCLRLLLLWHIYFGFGLCSYILWCWERSVRLTFVATKSIKGGKDVPKVDMLSKPSIAVQGAAILLGFGVCWKAMLDLARTVVTTETLGL
eukprot:evm.model.scf_2056.3 EVM.evm.TU.scf_2056.3   scf_2056:10645-13043(-)